MEVIYYYDSSFEGFLCCIFDSYLCKEIPAAIQCGGDAVLSLFSSRTVQTDRSHAARVLRKVSLIAPEAGTLLWHGFLSCLPEKEMHLYRFVAKLLREGPGFLRDRSNETLFPIARAVQHLREEAHLLKGFVRFSDLGGVLGGKIEPKNRVLPLLRSHFCARCHNERFFLYDRTNKEALFYANGKAVIQPLDYFQMAPPDETEARFRILWKRFYDTIAIKERYNPRCRMTHMPKRYWNTMTEFQCEDYFKAQTPPANAAIPGAPAVRPAPATPLESGLSAPASTP